MAVKQFKMYGVYVCGPLLIWARRKRFFARFSNQMMVPAVWYWHHPNLSIATYSIDKPGRLPPFQFSEALRMLFLYLQTTITCFPFAELEILLAHCLFLNEIMTPSHSMLVWCAYFRHVGDEWNCKQRMCFPLDLRGEYMYWLDVNWFS